MSPLLLWGYMTKDRFYFLTDDYCDKFKDYGVMSNKETIGSEVHRRPCFYSIPDPYNSDLYWMIPISSQVKKYYNILQKKLQKYPVYDGLEFGYVQGRHAAFLLQNICPVKKEHVIEEYINESNGKSVSIPNDLKRKLNAKARKIINLYYSGTKIVITDLDYIFENLQLKKENNQNSSEE